MAGDWLKIETCTPEKSEVLAITAAMGWDDADLAVGKLFRVWRWFDQQTLDGNAAGVTKALLDRVVGVSGLCDAMSAVGWLHVDDAGISLPNFDSHNGATAKSRAQGSKRASKHRSNAKSNAATVTDALPREEKRREEIDQEPIGAPTAHHVADAPASTVPEEPAQPVKPKAKRGTRLPADWSLPTEWAEWAASDRTEFTRVDIARVAESFADYWHAASKNAAKLDWFATWRNWFRNQRAPASNVRQFPARQVNGPDFDDDSWRFAPKDGK